jgi:predicted secreted protein
MNITSDNRSKKFIFIPFCSLAQAFHASGLVKFDWCGTITPVINEIVKKDINIIQMPCPESLFPNLEIGLVRAPKSYSKYDTPDFRAHCMKLAQDVLTQIKAILNNGYEIIGIIGIEYSPSCAVNIQYSNKGHINLSGIYIQELKKLLKENNISIPFLGINRRGIKTSVKRIVDLLNSENQLKMFDD